MTSITLSDATKAALAELKPPDLTWDDYLQVLLEALEPTTFEKRLRDRTERLHRTSVEAARRRVLGARRGMLLDQVREVIQQQMPRLRKQYKVKEVSLFGSVARREERPDSDIDLLIEYTETPGLQELIGLQLDLEERLGRKVDLGTRLSTEARQRAEKETVRLA